MEDSFVQIGACLRGLREVLDGPAQEVADLCDISLEQYEKIERGETDPSVSRLLKISKRYGIALDVLMFGEEPHMNGYFVTRKDKGMRVERRCDYRYQSLAAGFRMRNMDPFLVEVAPLPEGERRGQNAHDGQEFAMVLEGRLELTIENHCIVFIFCIIQKYLPNFNCKFICTATTRFIIQYIKLSLVILNNGVYTLRRIIVFNYSIFQYYHLYIGISLLYDGV